jgi:hypothetical protein
MEIVLTREIRCAATNQNNTDISDSWSCVAVCLVGKIKWPCQENVACQRELNAVRAYASAMGAAIFRVAFSTESRNQK